MWPELEQVGIWVPNSGTVPDSGEGPSVLAFDVFSFFSAFLPTCSYLTLLPQPPLFPPLPSFLLLLGEAKKNDL